MNAATTCTVVVTATGGTCGRPAVATFTGSNGTSYGECDDHHFYTSPADVAAALSSSSTPAAHPATRTTRPYVLVADGRIVGYANSASADVVRRADRLGAQVVKVVR